MYSYFDIDLIEAESPTFERVLFLLKRSLWNEKNHARFFMTMYRHGLKINPKACIFHSKNCKIFLVFTDLIKV